MPNTQDFWTVTLSRKLKATRNVTWGDVQECIRALNAASADVFAGLHRCEGGFMCVEGPGFRSEDRVDSGLPHQNPPADLSKMVHKEIRFYQADDLVNWPSSCCSFLGNTFLTDDWMVIHRGVELSFEFRGEHCVPWTRKQCTEYAQVVAHALGLEASSKRRRA